jgi:phage-related protein
MAITTAISDLVASVYELFASFVGAVYTIVHSFVMGIFSLFTGFFAFIADIFKGVFDIVGGVGKFVTGEFSQLWAKVIDGAQADVGNAGNIVILGIIGAGAFAYFRFTQQGQLQAQGNRPIAAKKTN